MYPTPGSPAGDRPVTPKSAWVFQNLLDTSHPEFGMAVNEIAMEVPPTVYLELTKRY